MISPCWLSALTFLLLLDLTFARQIALLIIDVQNCFLPGGSLAVAEGDKVIPVINNIRSEYKADISLVALSQDWHCSDHISFASQHKGAGPVIQLLYDKSGSLCDENNNCTEVAYNLTQHLWPDHCVINTSSANFSLSLTQEPSDIVIRKGYNCKVDSYSAFYDNGGFRYTELHDKLQEAGIEAIIITGLARDYCVYYTAMDAKQLGYETYVVLDATRPVTKATGDSAVADMKIKGIHIIESPDVATVIAQLTSDAIHLQSPFIIMISMILCFIKCVVCM
ncbi:nicotinamidase-like isoform X4 [Mytilus californianus]|uniref:nicotinamidase-like isoform X1 n=1 Tax=Mytilus californianus TaxID=6549 RepID=UPI0022460EB7|nr:nicotinamidase-like isoform X1 [Mytilus californianus]XP_052079384.1 nicotinamidase-like isoform X3 [Mytilus californianus]XP_052079385.1 nicotinamidase-like isoform X4 [Mytilus californianus]